MELSLNYGMRRYFISDNWFYIALFLVCICRFAQQKRKRDSERDPSLSPLNTRGGDNSVILQKLYDQCLSDDFYVEVNDSKVKQIIRKMLGIKPGKTVIISASVYLLAILKNNSTALVLESGGTRLIISNLRGFVSKGIGTVLFARLLALASTPIVVASLPLILTALLYSGLHVDCNSFVSTLPNTDGNLQYIEAPINEDAKIIVSPHTPKTLYHAFDETEVSSISSLSCYIKDNCLGPEQIQGKSRKVNLKPKRFIPLSERTKTLKDLKCHVDEIDEIAVNNVKYKQENE
jgi:hypothetical protein